MNTLKIKSTVAALVLMGAFSACKQNETVPSAAPETEMENMEIDTTNNGMDALEHDSITNPTVRSGM